MTRVTYFVLAPKANMVKIGQACEENPPSKRLKSLQTGCPEYLSVLLVLPFRPPFEEKQLHERFYKYHPHGEWFEYAGELKQFIQDKLKDGAPTREDDLAVNPQLGHVLGWKEEVNGRFTYL